MSNLIITVISIALVAVAAIMGAYYGGSAFFNAQAKAKASTLISQAQQIKAAWDLYALERGGSYALPMGNAITFNALVPKYLQEIPKQPGGANNGWFCRNANGEDCSSTAPGQNFVIVAENIDDNWESLFDFGAGQDPSNNPPDILDLKRFPVCKAVLDQAGGVGARGFPAVQVPPGQPSAHYADRYWEPASVTRQFDCFGYGDAGFTSYFGMLVKQ